MYCQKCGKKNPEGAKFCMHCGDNLSGYKVEISPKIEVSPKIEIKPSVSAKPTPSAEMCAICGKSRAVAVCKKCDRAVCAYHFEHDAECTLCNISAFTELLNSTSREFFEDQRRVRENPNDKGWKKSLEHDEDSVKAYEKVIENFKRKLR